MITALLKGIKSVVDENNLFLQRHHKEPFAEERATNVINTFKDILKFIDENGEKFLVNDWLRETFYKKDVLDGAFEVSAMLPANVGHSVGAMLIDPLSVDLNNELLSIGHALINSGECPVKRSQDAIRKLIVLMFLTNNSPIV